MSPKAPEKYGASPRDRARAPNSPRAEMSIELELGLVYKHIVVLSVLSRAWPVLQVCFTHVCIFTPILYSFLVYQKNILLEFAFILMQADILCKININ